MALDQTVNSVYTVFVKAAYLASKNNVKEMCFDIAKSIKLNLIAIDYLADWALKLSERDEKGSDNVEVFHASSSASLTTWISWKLSQENSEVKITIAC